MGSIRKNLALLVIITILPAVAILVYSGIEQRRSTIARAEKDVLIITHTMAQIQKDLAISVREVLSTIAILKEVQNLDINGLNGIFTDILQRNPNYDNITLVDLQGDILASGKKFDTENLADRKHFRDALATKDFAPGEFIVTRIGKEIRAFPFAFPVLDASGAPIAVLTAIIDLSRFSKLYTNAFLPDDSYIALTDYQGIRLFYYPQKETTNPVGQPIKKSAWEIVHKSQKPIVMNTPGSDGIKRIFACEPITTTTGTNPYMYVWAGVPETFILAPAYTAMQRNLLLMLLATIGALSIAWGFGRKTLLTPINKLIEVTNNFAQGKLHTNVENISKIAEFAKLSKSFNIMAISLATTQENLQSSEERFKKLSSLTFEGIMLHNDAIVLDTNDSLAQLFGYTIDEIIGSNAIELLFTSEAHPQLYASFAANVAPPLELIAQKKDGTLFPVEVESRDVHTEADHFVVTAVRDISERKQAEQQRIELEEQVRQKYKMEAVGVLAGGMAHNFNNNLSIILGNLELLQIKTHTDKEIAESLSNAKTAVLRSRDLIKQILNYSRHSTKEKITLKPTQIIAETVKLLKATLPKTINLQQHISADCHNLTIDADPSQIQECLINLCNNAMHAMDEKGDLTISLASVELHQQDIPAQYDAQPGHYAQINVQDSGCGISTEIADKIFDLFFTTKSVDEGTGVGLSTVQGIVTQHGGVVKVNSIVGSGTTFELYFPLNQADNSTQAETNDIAMPRGTERILFIEDDEMLANLSEKVLTSMGYRVTAMSDSTLAMELLTTDADQFDIVITDQTMPGITGKELIAQLKKIRADLPTILCTGYSSRINADSAAQLGIGAFLMKPVELAKLLQTVRSVLDGNKR
ncbi:MAG: ATP-binding protein [Desulfuromonas sp.]|nr:ATP-binding protein [Desulfuromonas sp.]